MKKIIISLAFLMIPFMFLMAQSSPVISFVKKTHDFGQIKKGVPVSHEFTFTNTGKSPLFLSEPRSSCGCTVPSYPKEPIMPGQEKSIKLTFDAESAGNFSKQVTIISNAENSPEILIIKGTVAP